MQDNIFFGQVGPCLFFVGFDLTLMGGLSWGNWGWEVGGKMADE